MVQAESTTEYGRQLVAMRVDLPAHVMKYLYDTWLIFKKMFVSCYLHGCLHYGHVTTSRVDSVHVAFKKWLNGSTCKYHYFGLNDISFRLLDDIFALR